jgi:DNA-binding response OmpR family regulator
MSGSVLLVEDEENLASLVQAYLEREGYSVVAVGSGAEALSALEQQPVRLVVLDLTLPEHGWARGLPADPGSLVGAGRDADGARR